MNEKEDTDEEEIKSLVESLSESDDGLDKLREKEEELSGVDELNLKELLEKEELGDIRSQIEKFGSIGDLEQKTGMKKFDALKYGAIIDKESVKGEKIVDSYWIEKPYTKVEIALDEETGEHEYKLLEPKLTEEEEKEINVIWEELKNRLPYTRIRENKEELLGEEYREILKERDIKDPRKIHRLLYYLVRDNLEYGSIDGLMRDDKIEDISCDGVNVPIYLFHRDFYNIKTNIKIGEKELDSFVRKLAEKGGSHISYADPVVEATLPDRSRLQAALGHEVTTRGSSFTIRKFGGGSFTPVDLIRFGTFAPEMLANIWIAIENGRSVIVVGGTASGKTSTLNAFGFFIPPDAKIVSIEDTRELSLYQDNWLPNLTRETGEGENLDMHELVRKALRQRPEAILVGEVRGREALAMFQAISTGHTGFSTMHSGSIQDAVNRLVGEPINLPKPMLAELDMMCLQLLTNLGDKKVRRNFKTVEFLGLESKSKGLKIIETYKWNRSDDNFSKREESQILREIREDEGMSMPEMKEEVERRSKLLRRMAEESMISYSKVASLIRQYYFNPEKALEKVSE